MTSAATTAATTAQLYNLPRWYQPATGRYPRPDPFGLDGGGPNIYLYALANPLRFFDPLGQRVVSEDFPPDRPGRVGVLPRWQP